MYFLESGRLDRASMSVLIIVDFPEHVGPININPCLTNDVSYNYMILRVHGGWNTSYFLETISLIYFSTYG